MILGKEAADKARYEALREQLGLNRPMTAQYLSWLGNVVTGDLGNSLVQDKPVTELLSRRVQNTFVLVLIAAVLSVPISLFLGSLTALPRDSKFDVTVSIGSLSLAALSEFVTGIVLILLFATQVFSWLPAVSRVDPNVPIYQQLELFVLPALTLTLAVAPYITRILRASTIEVLESEYVMMAPQARLPVHRWIGVKNSRCVRGKSSSIVTLTCMTPLMLAGRPPADHSRS